MHTFDDVSRLARTGIVSDQWVERHGTVTNVVKNAISVVKSVVKSAAVEVSGAG